LAHLKENKDYYKIIVDQRLHKRIISDKSLKSGNRGVFDVYVHGVLSKRLHTWSAVIKLVNKNRSLGNHGQVLESFPDIIMADTVVLTF
jgi:hypothetical protein